MKDKNKGLPGSFYQKIRQEVQRSLLYGGSTIRGNQNGLLDGKGRNKEDSSLDVFIYLEEENKGFHLGAQNAKPWELFFAIDQRERCYLELETQDKRFIATKGWDPEEEAFVICGLISSPDGVMLVFYDSRLPMDTVFIEESHPSYTVENMFVALKALYGVEEENEQ